MKNLLRRRQFCTNVKGCDRCNIGMNEGLKGFPYIRVYGAILPALISFWRFFLILF